MTSRERVLKALNFEEPDRVPIDLGGTIMSGIMAHARVPLARGCHWLLVSQCCVGKNAVDRWQPCVPVKALADKQPVAPRRICFRWERGDAYEVEIADYH